MIDKPGFQARALYGMVWCYVKMKDRETAEVFLKKLINQFPDSHLAIEGILLMSKWRFLKASLLWDYKRNTIQNRDKLAEYESLIENKIEDGIVDVSDGDEIRRKLATIKFNLSSRINVPSDEINTLFKEAIDLIDYIRIHYRSGEYSEVIFSTDREKILLKLRNVLENKKADLKDEKFDRTVFMDKLYESRLLHFEMVLKYREWLNEYLAFAESGDSTRKDVLHSFYTPPDSADNKSTEGILRNRVLEKISEFTTLSLELVDGLIASPESEPDRDRFLYYKGLILLEKEEKQYSIISIRKELLESYFTRAGAAGFEISSSLNNSDFEKVWVKLIVDYPESPYHSYCLYNLGVSLARQNDPRALNILEVFLKLYPDHEYVEHAMTLIGDYYFSKDDFEQAMGVFLEVMSSPESKYFDKALYKQAWSFYKNGQYSNSLKLFSFMLEELLTNEQDSEESAVIKEILGMVAFSFAELDTSLSGNDQAVKTFISGFRNRVLASRILHKMSAVYQQQGRIKKAKSILKSIVREYKDYENIPEVMMDLALSHDIENEFDSAVVIRETLFETYNRRSEWYKNLENDLFQTRADSICEIALNKIAFHYFAEAKLFKGKTTDKIHNRETFMKAIRVYEKFLDIYPDSRNAPKLYYQLAESLFSIEDFYNASKAYLRASNSRESGLRNAASFNAIVAAQKHLESRGKDDD